MEFIKPYVELYEEPSTVQGMYDSIATVARVCTNSQSRGNSKEFVDRLIAMKHLSPLEHGKVYLVFSSNLPRAFQGSPFVSVKYDSHCFYVTTNYRFLHENHLEYFLDSSFEQTSHHEVLVTLKIGCAIEVYKDLTRHRCMSPMVESTRFCNYSKGKFGSSVKFSLPCWLKEEDESFCKNSLETIEAIYLEATKRGWSAEKASYFLPQGTYATMYLTGTECAWKSLMNKRYYQTTGPVRPDVLEVTTQMFNILSEQYQWNPRMS